MCLIIVVSKTRYDHDCIVFIDADQCEDNAFGLKPAYTRCSYPQLHTNQMSALLNNSDAGVKTAFGLKPASHHQQCGGERCGKRKRSTIFTERTREGHHQSDEHWNCFRGNVGKLLRDRVERVIIGFSELELNSTSIILGAMIHNHTPAASSCEQSPAQAT